VALADEGHRLLTVNAGSNTISAFAVKEDGRLELIGIAPSGGTEPISISAHGRLVYVLNAGNNTVSGLLLGSRGLTPIAGSTRSLSAGAQGPAQASFAPDGQLLVVTEKASNTIDTFQRGDDGLLGALTTTASDGATPFGFDFDRAGHVVVSDAFGGAPGASALTTYRATDDGALHSIALVPNGQAAACWVVINRRGDAFVTNTGSGNVSSYSIGHDGTPTLLAANAATTGGHPTDEAIGHGRLFVLDSSTGRIVSASVQSSGGLGAVSTGTNSLPASTVGLATATDQ
jgi:6-phosphogluconolactonase (cycloisomerase 2 family)